MKKEIKAKWVAALRSGDYIQGSGQLRDFENNFCCLGVLCNIHAIENPDFAATQSQLELYDGRVWDLSPKLVKWSGLDDYDILVSMNDGDENGQGSLSFNEIADYIEENY